MFTTYDEVYKVYMGLVRGVEQYSLPLSIREQYDLIELGVMLFNRKREEHEISCDEDTESLINMENEPLSANEVLLLAHCMRLQTYSNMLQELVSMLSMATKDSALKDYKGQASVRRQMVKDEEALINNLILTMLEFDVEEV